MLHSRSGGGDERREPAALPDDGCLMAQLILNGPHRELLWKLTTGWPPPTLPANNLEDPAEHLLSIGLAEVVDGGLRQHKPATISALGSSAKSYERPPCAGERHRRGRHRAVQG